MNMPKPLLLLSDSITGPTGLGRITRELAVRIHERMADVCRVGVCGLGATTSRKFPFAQYPIQTDKNWVINELPQVWNDFAGDERGVILAIWNASWLPWMADPKLLPKGDVKNLLEADRFDKWLYAPVDSDGPNERLPESQGKIMAGFDRLATYTDWAKGVIERTGAAHGHTFDCAVLPHGTETSIFHPRSRSEARKEHFLGTVVQEDKGHVADDVVLVGVVATNTARKDWPLAFEVCAELLKRGVHVGLWAHTDAFRKHWDLLTLADEFGMRERVIFTNNHLSDDSLAWGIAACDVTLGIGSGEGWGLPISESLAMGIPCVTGNYAGVTDFTPVALRMKPVGFRYDGFYACRRPVYNAAEWADFIFRMTPGTPYRLEPRFFWESGAWDLWEKWLRAGL